MLLLLLACAPTPVTLRTAPPSGPGGETTGGVPSAETAAALPRDSAAPPETADTAEAPSPACPAEMAYLGSFCIDRWEAALEGRSPYGPPDGEGRAIAAAGQVPAGYLSGDQAEAACWAAGKRLCTSDEWRSACQGPAGRAFPYGDTYQAGACNEGRATHPVIDLFGAAADWSSEQMNDPRLNQLPDSLAPSGSSAGCVTPEGVYDLHGNLHEWVADAEGTFRGGFYVDATLNGPGCAYTTTAHDRGYHDYSTGFRCCRDPDLPGDP
jgi:formylglycine-generating enzyme required for sulfatase activity